MQKNYSAVSMATWDRIEDCMLRRGRSQSDPNIVTESGIDLPRGLDLMDQQRALHSAGLVTGLRTPPIGRKSKLASLGRMFKPWKWRKKKNEKLKQSSTALEKKAAVRQNRAELVRNERSSVAGADFVLACAQGPLDSDPSQQGSSDMGEKEEWTLEDMDSDKDCPSAGRISAHPSDVLGKLNAVAGVQDQQDDCADTVSEGICENHEEEEEAREDTAVGDAGAAPQPSLVAKTLPKHGTMEDSGRFSQSPQQKISAFPKDSPTLRGQSSTPTGSPHLAKLHSSLPPSCIIEELHRALATKHRQDSFRGREGRSSPKRRSEVQLCSVDQGRAGEAESRKDCEENKENLWQDTFHRDGFSFDQDSWNNSVISGTLPRRMKKELLAVKLRNRPSKQELEERNIFPSRSDLERQQIRQQIETKLAKRLSQRPAVEELESRNILKQRNDQTEQEERREIKQRLNRKLNQRPTVDELRDRKILIRFSDYVEVAKAQDYDRRADKPWTRLSASDKAAIRKELNEFKSNEMEVHASSKHLTRFHRP
ncbi:phosphatase and actin regulator 3a isoform X2 [Brienomyrus brachyistius]|uniref:phosphatase and actin regulator 3a isoform X2 n=1 Tax=Brienomyrus brachyistius TaxID=42636 RepID=UPI0020B32F81|nr:phosphatase and actin regulator 3a isoform X2 [Brienomyrus brachyistius]